MAEWIDRAAALALLGIRPQTLYAYVSRGRIGMQPDPADPRRSLYRAEDISALRIRRARGRRPETIAASAIAWGEPSITTGISTVHHGTLIYRGRNAAAWARSATLEETAALLWQDPGTIDFAAANSASGSSFQALAALLPSSDPTVGRSAERLRRDARMVIGTLAGSLGADTGPEPVHMRLARAWGLVGIDMDRVRRALVLLADHELNASTFATRVAASTGASIAASLLAGLSALSGPRHGGAGAALCALIGEAERIGAAAAVSAWLAHRQALPGFDRVLPGFGHPLYPDGDARAILLLEDLAVDGVATDLCKAVADATGALPNIDFALAAFTRANRLPAHAPLSLFTLGRSVGWAAHAIEQITEGSLIRPRARYMGPELVG